MNYKCMNCDKWFITTILSDKITPRRKCPHCGFNEKVEFYEAHDLHLIIKNKYTKKSK